MPFIVEDAELRITSSFGVSFYPHNGHTAEGVETNEALKKLLKYGCDEVQGYFFQNLCLLTNFLSGFTPDKNLYEYQIEFL